MVTIDVQSMGVPTPCFQGGGGKPAIKKLAGIELLFNVCYHICVSPFRIAKVTGGRKLVRSSRIRKVACFILHLSVVLYQTIGTICAIRMDLKAKNQKFIFNLGFRATSIGFTFSILRILWRSRNGFEKFINESVPRNGTRKGRGSKWWINWLVLAAMAGMLMATVVYACYPNPIELDWLRKFLDVVGCTRAPRNTKATGGVNLWWDLFMETNNIGGKVTVVLHFWVKMYSFLFERFAWLLLLTISSEVYWIATDLGNLACGELRHRYLLLTGYGKARENIGLINRAVSPAILFNTAQMAIFAALMLPNAMHISKPTMVGTALVNMATNVGTYLLAAEAQKKVREVKRLLISRFPITESSNVATFLENLPGEDGLSGGDFFIVSYQFLGTMMAAVFTYILVVLQMVPGHSI